MMKKNIYENAKISVAILDFAITAGIFVLAVIIASCF